MGLPYHFFYWFWKFYILHSMLTIDVSFCRKFEDTYPQHRITGLHNLFRNTSLRPGTGILRVLSVDGGHIVIGTRNTMLNLSAVDMKPTIRELTWNPSSNKAADCRNNMQYKGMRPNCENYIRSVAHQADGSVFVCGTHAMSPSCRRYSLSAGGYTLVPGSDIDGLGRVPADPLFNNTADVIDGSTYAGVPVDGIANSIYVRFAPDDNRIWSAAENPRSLNNPQFLKQYDIGDKMYFVIRESAFLDEAHGGTHTVSRIGRVCKNDRGFDRRPDRWTSFLKTTLVCKRPGEYRTEDFHYPILNGISDLGHQTLDNGQSARTVFYGAFATPPNAIAGAAICLFNMSAVEKVFAGPFRHQQESHWGGIVHWDEGMFSQKIVEHPGKTCPTSPMPSKYESFVEEHQIMSEDVESQYGRPIYVQAAPDVRITAIATDFGVRDKDGTRSDIIFAGTADGRVLKLSHDIDDGEANARIIEEVKVFDEPFPGIADLRMVETSEGKRLVVVAMDQARSIALQRCDKYLDCSSCVAARDPYCAWTNNVCSTIMHKSSYQNIKTGRHSSCPPSRNQPLPKDMLKLTKLPETASVLNPDTPLAATSCEASLDGYVTSHVMVIALIFCIIIALFVGFAAGFFARRRYCSRLRRDDETEEFCTDSYPKGFPTSPKLDNDARSKENSNGHLKMITTVKNPLNNQQNFKSHLVREETFADSPKTLL